MHVLNNQDLVNRLFVCLVFTFAIMVIMADPSLVLAGTGRIKLADVGTSAFDSFSEYAQYGGAALFTCGAIPALAGRDMGGLGTGLISTGAGLGCIRYVPDFLSIIKGNGGLL